MPLKPSNPIIHYIETDELDPELVFELLEPYREDELSRTFFIWKNQGRYRLIPPAVILNYREAVKAHAAQQKFFARSPNVITCPIRWNQGIGLSPTAAVMLQCITIEGRPIVYEPGNDGDSSLVYFSTKQLNEQAAKPTSHGEGRS